MATLPLRYRAYFQDECPRLGAGWRTVYVIAGTKWVRLAALIAEKTRETKAIWARTKLSCDQWAPIARHGHELPPRKRRRRA